MLLFSSLVNTGSELKLITITLTAHSCDKVYRPVIIIESSAA